MAAAIDSTTLPSVFLHLLRILLFTLPVTASLAEKPFPIGFPKLEKTKAGYHLMVDGSPYLILGTQVHNSSGWAGSLAEMWPSIRQFHANTVMIPVYWEAIESREGEFDFSTVDATLKGARENGLRLTLLWFGSWKNGGMAYTPTWIKSDPVSYPRVIDRDGHSVAALSSLSVKSAEADARAFAALMKHLKEHDADRHTVIMVQVENEAGTLGSDRDYSPEANRLFDQEVPEEVTASLHKQPGTWSQVFGADAPEAFSSYHTARYIERVAGVGKAVFPLPLYVNVWPREQSGLLRPGFSSPSGGAVTAYIDMWKTVAPSIDVIGPDNYDSNFQPFLDIAARYTRDDNPLLVPETGGGMEHARHMFYVIATPGSLGISMFGVNPPVSEGAGGKKEEEVAIDYRLVGPVVPVLLAARDAGGLKAAVEEEGISNRELTFDDYDAVVRFGQIRGSYSGEKGTGNPDVGGRVLVARIAPGEFLILGCNANVVFSPKLGDSLRHVSYLTVEEGSYRDGKWQMDRLLNGDETWFGLVLPHEGKTLRVRVMKY